MTSLWLRRGFTMLAVGVALGAAGCGGDNERSSTPRAKTDAATEARTTTVETATASRRRATPPLRPARCPTDLTGCEAVTGRVAYVEAVDPDGDGDAHFVLAGGSVTAPGFSAIDVRVGLRPKPLPRIGDTVTAAGQVQTGSKGQSQIHAVEVCARYIR